MLKKNIIARFARHAGRRRTRNVKKEKRRLRWGKILCAVFLSLTNSEKKTCSISLFGCVKSIHGAFMLAITISDRTQIFSFFCLRLFLAFRTHSSEQEGKEMKLFLLIKQQARGIILHFFSHRVLVLRNLLSTPSELSLIFLLVILEVFLSPALSTASVFFTRLSTLYRNGTFCLVK
jgi:membrane-associated HD superfamily phosphohydrolase